MSDHVPPAAPATSAGSFPCPHPKAASDLRIQPSPTASASSSPPPRPKDAVYARVEKLFTAMGKDAANASEGITVHDILRHIDAVEALAPTLLIDFTKIDHRSAGRISADQLKSYLNPGQETGLGQRELRQAWERITSGRVAQLPNDRVYADDLARHYDFVNDEIPDLIERFREVDTSNSFSIGRADFDSFLGGGEAWLEGKLVDIIGLDGLKDQLREFYWATKLDRLRRQGGAFIVDEEAHVLMLKGNPGVGKTTVARLLSGLLHKTGVIPSDTFVEVQRDQLVGDHIGATEKATADAIARARGGVLFVDDAYRLNADVFGVEAINCLMRAMTSRGSVIILAGYPEQMDEFASVNPGIKRRVTYEFTLPDHSAEDLARIFQRQVKERGFEIDPAVATEELAATIEHCTTEGQRQSLNGGVGEHACRHAIFSLNKRQIDIVRGSDNAENFVPSIRLQLEDIEYGCSQVPDVCGVGERELPGTKLNLRTPSLSTSASSASLCSASSSAESATLGALVVSKDRQDRFKDWLFSGEL